MNRPYHILIIDDDPDDRDFLMEAFSDRFPGTRFTTMDTGRAALEFLHSFTDQEGCPDIAFLDLYLPGKSGYEVLLELRAGGQCREIPVMIISTFMHPSEVEKYRQAGCTGFFTKPISMEGYEAIAKAACDYFRSTTA